MFIGAALLIAVPAMAAGTKLTLTDQNRVAKTHFELTDQIYIQGFCLTGSNQPFAILIANDKTWHAGDPLTDISSNIEVVAIENGTDENLPRTLIWAHPYAGNFDVVVDTDGDYILGSSEHCIIGETDTGFTVGTPAPAATPTPVPSIAPPPPPPASAEPSTSLALDDYVKVKNLSNVRKSPGGAMIGTQPDGALGIIIGGPVRASLGGASYWFWNVNFDEDPDGWVAESTIKRTLAPTKPSELKPTVEPTTAPPPVNATAQTPPANEPVAQVSNSSATNSVTGPLIVGMAILLGFIFGAFIIAQALRRP